MRTITVVLTAGLALCSAAALAHGEAAPRAGVIFSSAIPNIPGKRLVVVALPLAPVSSRSVPRHRHPGSVYVYVTQGTARLGLEGQPVQIVHTGESFFEPPGALHTVAESASASEPAAAIAVMILPEGAPLLIPEKGKN